MGAPENRSLKYQGHGKKNESTKIVPVFFRDANRRRISMEPEFVAIGPDEEFYFSCDPEVSCFNACCRNLYQVLTPYDILRLKRTVGLSSGEFLREYTQQGIGPESGLPVVSLRPVPGEEMACPFVTPQGCRVYPDRPASCRIYPLARAVSRCRETGRLIEHYALLKESHCCGFNRGGSQSVKQWISTQELKNYHAMNDLMLEIIALKNKHRPGILDLVLQRYFQMALYDLDAFRKFIDADENPILTAMMSEEKLGSAVKGEKEDDDVALLKLGFRWIAKLIDT